MVNHGDLLAQVTLRGTHLLNNHERRHSRDSRREIFFSLTHTFQELVVAVSAAPRLFGAGRSRRIRKPRTSLPPSG
jgi:hypothetical protein